MIFFENSRFAYHRESAKLTSNVLQQSPDIILHNARIYTVDAAKPWASAVAIQRGEIVAVGDSVDLLALATDTTTLYDLEDRLVLPGLCDSHIHFYDLEPCPNPAQFLSNAQQGGDALSDSRTS